MYSFLVYASGEKQTAGVWQFLFDLATSVFRLYGCKIILSKRTAQLNIKAVVIHGTSCSLLFVTRSR